LFATRSLDALLQELTPRASASSRALSFGALEAALDRAESLAEHIPRLPRTCFYRCLARYAVFCRHGFAAEFVMAVSPRGPDADGHAWLEFDGVPYREGRASEFVVSYRYPVHGRG
jgi:Transglutaminase-like superfamily